MDLFLDVAYRMHNKVPFGYHSHHEYEVYFFHEGACRYLIHNHIYDLEPGDIILMNGLTMHRPNFLPNQAYVRSVLHFIPQMIQDVLDALDSSHLLSIFQDQTHVFIRTNENEEAQELERILQEMVHLQQSTDIQEPGKIASLKILIVQMLLLIDELVQRKELQHTRKSDIKSEHAENIATYIQDHFRNHLDREQISDNLNISKAYASEVFKEMTGFTIMEYVMECRLNEAKYLLEMEPDKSIKDIAFTSGFESASHFSRYFRSKVNTTAGKYRNKRLALFTIN